jgi:hypothetical protein
MNRTVRIVASWSNQAIDLAVRTPFVIIEAKILPDGAIHNEIRQAVGQL